MKRRNFLSTTVLTIGLLTSCLPTAVTPGKIAVTASVSSATLANDCPATREASFAPGRCAPLASSDAGADLAWGCGGFCQQSNMQLNFVASAGNGSVHVEVVAVRLLDAKTGSVLDTLTAREPRRWNDSSNGYVAWDGELGAGTTLRASYNLSAADWTRIGGGNAWNTYSRRFQLEVVLRIDGSEQTIRSAELSREPEIVT